MTDLNSVGANPAAAFTRLPGQQESAASQAPEREAAPSNSSVTVSVAAQQRLAAENQRAEATAVVQEPASGLQQRIESLVGTRSLTDTQAAATEASGGRIQPTVAEGQAALRESGRSGESTAANQREAQQQPTATDPTRRENGTDLTA